MNFSCKFCFQGFIGRAKRLNLRGNTFYTAHRFFQIRGVLRRKSRTRSANALLAVVEGITRPVRTWSQAN